MSERQTTSVVGRGETLLEVRGIRKSYGDLVAIDDVSLTLAAGQLVALLGPNGAGKTTLISVIAGLRRPDAGKVGVGGVDVEAEPRSARKLLGLAPQDVGVYPLVSVREDLAFFGQLFGLRGAALQRRVEEVAEALDLSTLLEREAGSLSGGERRRVHTAMALIHRPPLLLLDEPTEGADVKSRREMLELVRNLAQEGAAILYSTHRLDEVEWLDAGVAILDGGRLVAQGPVGELVSSHAQLVVEIAVDGPTPGSLADHVAGDGLVRIPTTDAASTIAHALSAFGSDSARLRSIEIIRPRLESVYLQLTGRRYGDGEPTTE